MRKIISILILIFSISFQSCHKEEDIDFNEKTLLIFMPWSPTLYSNFQQNIADLMNSIQQVGLQNQRVVAFLCYNDASKRDNKIYGRLFELKLEKGKCVEVPLEVLSYDTNGTKADFMTPTGMAKVFAKMKNIAPAKEYSMIFGCHGAGWLPITRTKINSKTRWIGGDYEFYQAEVSTLKQALENAGIKLNFLLFDDCYMSTVEVAYELRNSTDYLIASPTEIMNYGMPYHKIGRYLLGNPDFKSICDEFKSFYSTYIDEYGDSYPFGTIAVTKTEKLEELAKFVKNINSNYELYKATDIQKMDGYTPTIFFDFNDYFTHLITDSSDLSELLRIIGEVVPYKANTDYYYSDVNDKAWIINCYTGLSISDLSSNSLAIHSKKNTSWWIATH